MTTREQAWGRSVAQAREGSRVPARVARRRGQASGCRFCVPRSEQALVWRHRQKRGSARRILWRDRTRLAWDGESRDVSGDGAAGEVERDSGRASGRVAVHRWPAVEGGRRDWHLVAATRRTTHV